MFDSILNSLKGEITESLTTSTLNLSDADVDQTVSSSKDAVEKTIAEETKTNGMETLVNLFSSDKNSTSSSNLLKSLGGNLISSLTSNGFDSGKASSITNLVLPIITSILSKKVNGDSNNLKSMLNSSGIVDKATGFLKNLF